MHSGPRAEAAQRVGGRFDIRVLEPSPPVVNEPPFFADDPVAGGEVLPIERPGARTWQDLCQEWAPRDPDLAGWCADRWLAAWHRLTDLPASFAETLRALHAVAEHVVVPARHQANGKIGLRFTRAGFGTPFFGTGSQVRVEDGQLVLVSGGEVRRATITTLKAAGEFVGVRPGAPTDVYTPATTFDPEVPLVVDEAAAGALGAWYGFCASVLEQLRSESADASRVQLWPEHFDLAVDLGDDAAGQRANYGGSPGDEGHPEPYLYVGPWTHQDGSYWNESFGSSLSYSELVEAGDQRQVALDWLRQGHDLLAGAGEPGGR